MSTARPGLPYPCVYKGKWRVNAYLKGRLRDHMMRNAGKGPLWVIFTFQFLTFFNRYMFKLLICVLFVGKLYTSVLKYGFV